MPDESSTLETAGTRLFVAAFLILGFVPFVNWIPGGVSAPWFDLRLSEWASGSSIAVGAALVFLIISRRIDWELTVGRRLVAAADAHPRVAAVVIWSLALAAYSVVAVVVFSRDALHLDEIAQLFQARVFAEGRVVAPPPLHPEFTSLLHLVDSGAGRFSQFPPGGPLLLVPGVLAGVPWLINPVLGATSAVLMWFVARRHETPAVALSAAMLMAFAPFTLFMSGSHMNHVGSLFLMMVALSGLSCCHRSRGAPFLPAMLCGFGLGLLALVRPVDGLAWAVPAAIWLVILAVRRRDLRMPAGAALGLVVPVAGLLLYNRATTGDVFLFAYELQWGKEHGLGFHRSPWGQLHTPVHGLELLNVYFLRLQTYLFETPVPSLVFPAAGLWFTRRLNSLDRFLAGGMVMLCGLYFAYWHDGFYLGPRFVYLLLPAFALWTARLVPAVRARWGGGSIGGTDSVTGAGMGLMKERERGRERGRDAARFASSLLVVSLVIAGVAAVPGRWRQYASGLKSMRHDVTARAAEQGIDDALILVRESWGSQLIARMWALGLSRQFVEAAYRTVDACELEETITRLEMRGAGPTEAQLAIAAEQGDSALLVPSPLSPDRSQRHLTGARYSEVCLARVAEDRSGFTLFAPLLAVDWGSNRFARDLHARDTLLLDANRGRRVFLLKPSSSEEGISPALWPVSIDSALLSWRNHGRYQAP
ncbi:MAG: hypothetical protein ACT4OZ_06535 [Gemmatimonadota bacterium]